MGSSEDAARGVMSSSSPSSSSYACFGGGGGARGLPSKDHHHHHHHQPHHPHAHHLPDTNNNNSEGGVGGDVLGGLAALEDLAAPSPDYALGADPFAAAAAALDHISPTLGLGLGFAGDVLPPFSPAAPVAPAPALKGGRSPRRIGRASNAFEPYHHHHHHHHHHHPHHHHQQQHHSAGAGEPLAGYDFLMDAAAGAQADTTTDPNNNSGDKPCVATPSADPLKSEPAPPTDPPAPPPPPPPPPPAPPKPPAEETAPPNRCRPVGDGGGGVGGAGRGGSRSTAAAHAPSQATPPAAQQVPAQDGQRAGEGPHEGDQRRLRAPAKGRAGAVPFAVGPVVPAPAARGRVPVSRGRPQPRRRQRPWRREAHQNHHAAPRHALHRGAQPTSAVHGSSHGSPAGAGPASTATAAAPTPATTTLSCACAVGLPDGAPAARAVLPARRRRPVAHGCVAVRAPAVRGAAPRRAHGVAGGVAILSPRFRPPVHPARAGGLVLVTATHVGGPATIGAAGPRTDQRSTELLFDGEPGSCSSCANPETKLEYAAIGSASVAGYSWSSTNSALKHWLIHEKHEKCLLNVQKFNSMFNNKTPLNKARTSTRSFVTSRACLRLANPRSSHARVKYNWQQFVF